MERPYLRTLIGIRVKCKKKKWTNHNVYSWDRIFLVAKTSHCGENSFMMPLKHCSENNHTLHKVTEVPEYNFCSNSLMATGKCSRIIIFRFFPSWSFVVLSFSTNLWFSLHYSSFMWIEPTTSRHSNDDETTSGSESGQRKEERKTNFFFVLM